MERKESRTTRLLAQMIGADMVSVFVELTLRRNSMRVERMNPAGDIAQLGAPVKRAGGSKVKP